MSWTKHQLTRSWPDGPNPFSSDDEPKRNGQLVDCGAVLDAMRAHERLMDNCTCAWDIDWEGRGVSQPPAGGCPNHLEEPQDDARMTFESTGGPTCRRTELGIYLEMMTTRASRYRWRARRDARASVPGPQSSSF